MRHPLWIFNSALLFLSFIVIGFIILSRQKLPSREDIEPEEYAKPIKDEVAKINISKIYENDLFGTYRKEFPMPEQGLITPIPQPPVPKRPSVPEPPAAPFLDPLNVTLKGIIVFVHNDTRNKVIIADNKTQIETTYRVGDTLEDAQLIRIFNNKALFLRSNGQQEILYLREKDAQDDPSYIVIKYWESVVQKVSDNNYLISPREFITRVANSSQFIDMLDLTTVYQKGKSIGCRIGKLAEKSLGTELGLLNKDIILTINEIPATDTPHRFQIYKDLISMQENDIISVKLLRDNQEFEIRYTLKDFKPVEEISAKEKKKELPPEVIRDEHLKMLQQKHKFAPTVEEIRAQERKNMLQRGRRPLKNKKIKAE